MTDNRRTTTRHTVSLAGKVTVGGATQDCTVVNLSLGGALVQAGPRAKMGERVHITFRIPTLENAIDVGATVRWSDSNGIGLQFDGLRAHDVWGLNAYFRKLAS